MPDTTEKIQWHPAFHDAIRAELDEYVGYLNIIPERQLVTEPLRVDLLIIKKLSDVKIDKNIARIFMRDNILEYKAPGDSLSVGDYNKVFGYAYIYAYLEQLDIRGITVSLVTSSHPDSVLKYLNERTDVSVSKVSNGIYYIHNEIMPVQIITTKYLNDDENLWLSSLTDNITESRFDKVIMERQKLSAEINALLYAMTIANPTVFKEGYKRMGTTFEAVLAEIGFVDKSALEKAEAEKKRIIMRSEEKLAKLAIKAELEKAQLTAQADSDKAQLIAKAEFEKAQLVTKAETAEVEKAQLTEKVRLQEKIEKENARLHGNLLEAALDMLRLGTPISTITKWTSLPEDEILRLQEVIDLELGE